MIKVTRYDALGNLHHTCRTDEVKVITDDEGVICVDMPWRFWIMSPNGRFEIEAV